MVSKEQDVQRQCHRGAHDKEAAMKIFQDRQNIIEKGGLHSKETIDRRHSR